MSTQPSQHYVDVPGGRVYYEVRGSGPLLLVIGQPMTSGGLASLAEVLAEEHTAVTYDPHGLGESTVEDPSLAVTPEVEADDLAAIVDALGGGTADLFATSGGAVAALAFAVRHPKKAGTVIAHEPPLAELLPDAQPIRTVVDNVENAYREYGTGAAWGKFVSLVIHDGLVTEEGLPPVSWPPPGAEAEVTDAGPPPEPSDKQRADDELFFLRMLKPFTRYEPPIEALRSGEPRVVVAFGAASRGQIPRRAAEALAQQLETAPVEFPGDHAGFMADPEGFATTIRKVLSEAG